MQYTSEPLYTITTNPPDLTRLPADRGYVYGGYNAGPRRDEMAGIYPHYPRLVHFGVS